MANLFAKQTAEGAANGSNWSNCFGPAELDTWITTAANAADVCYCLSGAYAMPHVNTVRAGLPATPIWLIGVKNAVPAPNYADWATGNDRPLSIQGGNQFIVGNYWRMHNFRGTGSGSYVFRGSEGTIFENCKAENTAVGGTPAAIGLVGSYAKVINCKLACTVGRAVSTLHYGNVIGCILRDSATGAVVGGSNLRAVLNLILNCDVGIDLQSKVNCMVLHNTLYNGVTGINGGNAYAATVLNNIISGFTVPASWITEMRSCIFDHNVWHASDVPLNVTKGPHAINQDPEFVDPAAGDFRLTVPIVGLTPGSVGSTIVGPIHYGPPLPPPAGPDHAADQLTLDGLETIQLDGIVIANAYRLEEKLGEKDESQGVYQARDVEFDLPTGVYLPGNDPRIGGVIKDADGVQYQILEVRQPYRNDFWGCQTRSLAISGEYNLDHVITLWPASVSTNPFGGAITTFPSADSTFSNVPCKIQEQPESVKDHVGKRGFVRKFDIYVERDIELNYGDRLIDGDGMWYTIQTSRNRESIQQYSTLTAVMKP